ncbi:MAG: hypothetical protein ABEK17_00485 [Candidatus Aenigmatarchaeota archaeon]
MNRRKLFFVLIAVLLTGFFFVTISDDMKAATYPEKEICCCIPNCYDYTYCYIERIESACQAGHISCPSSVCDWGSTTTTTTTTSTTTTSTTTTTTTLEENTCNGFLCCYRIRDVCWKNHCCDVSCHTSGICSGCPQITSCSGYCNEREDCLKDTRSTTTTTSSTTTSTTTTTTTTTTTSTTTTSTTTTASTMNTTTTTIPNYPLKGNLSISENETKIYKKVSISVEGKDKNGMKYIDVVKNKSHLINKTTKCNETEYCQLNWNFSLDEPGNYTYWGYLMGSKPNGENEVSYTVPKNVKIEVDDLELKLHSATIKNNSLIINYTKDFKKCVNVEKLGNDDDKNSYLICEKGVNRTFINSLNNFTIEEDEAIKLCHIKLDELCSKPLFVEKVKSKKDSKPPHIINITTEPRDPTIMDTVVIKATVMDTNSSINSCNISLNSKNYFPLNPYDGDLNSKEENIYKKLFGLTKGENKVTIECSDFYGNTRKINYSLQIKSLKCREMDDGNDPENPSYLMYGNNKYMDTCQYNQLQEIYCTDRLRTDTYDCDEYCKKEFGPNFEGNCISDGEGGYCDCKNKRCHKIEVNGNPKEKIDFVFVASNYPKGFNFEEHALKHLDFDKKYNGIFSYDPFEGERNRFNFYYVNLGKKYGCDGMCNYAEILKDASNCPYDQIMVLVENSTGGGYAYKGEGFAVSKAWKKLQGEDFWNDWTWVTTHEFGHSFGGLEDAYYNERSISETKGPNCDTKGCPKWCNSTKVPNPSLCYANNNKSTCKKQVVPFSEKDCKWVEGNPPYYSSFCAPDFDPYRNFGSDCTKDVGCFWNCKGGNGFKPKARSIMAGNKNGFNQISKRFIRKIIGCCYPSSQEEFNKEMCVKWANKEATLNNLDWAKEECTKFGD